MLHTRSMSLWVFAISIFGLLSHDAPAAETSPWLEIHSPHFTVLTDAGDKRGREVALRFEQMRAVFASLLTKEHLNQPAPLTILALNNDKSYYQLAPLHDGQPTALPGFVLVGEDQDFIALNLSEAEPWRAVAHDFAHMLLNYNYPPAQGWFDEGLAEYFNSIRLDNKQVEIGGDPELSSTGTQDSTGAHRSQSFTQLLATQDWIPLADLFTTKHVASDYNQGVQHTMYNAESWILMDYLLHEKKLPETGTYFDLVLNRHLSVEEAIQKAFGVSSAQLLDAVKSYLHSQPQLASPNPAATAGTSAQNSAPTYQFPTPVAPDDSVMTSKPLSEADARALYAGVQVRIPERRDLGLQTLKSLATTPTAADIKSETKKQERDKKDADDNPSTLPTNAVGNEVAHRFLAWDHIEHSEFDDAVTELGNSAALSQRDMWVRYYLSALKYRMAQAKHGDIQGLANMMLDLRAVLEWYPEMAGAYDLLAVARNEGGSSATAMQSERAAMMLSPRDQRYVYHLAQIYISSRQWEAAKSLLERLKDSPNPQIATAARERIDQMGTERKYGIAGSAAMQSKLAPQKSPFDVLEQDAAKRAADEKTQSASADTRPTKFFKGRLIAVDCSSAPAAVLTITAQGVVLKLRVGDYKSLLLIGADDFSCTWRDRQVTANYKPGGLSDGDLVSLEVR